MKVTELSLIADDDRLPERPTNSRLLHIGEGVTAEMRARKLDDPSFWKVVVWVRAVDRRKSPRRAAIIGGILQVEWHVDPQDLEQPYAEYRELVFDAIDEALGRASTELSWDSTAVLESIAAVRPRDRLGLIELDWLRKRLPRRNAEIRVFHEVTETDAGTWAEIRGDAGDVRRVELRQEAFPVGVWASFPGWSAKVVADEYVVIRKDGRELTRVQLGGPSV